MNFTYENQGTNTFLVYEMTESDSVDGVSLGMLTNNHIPGLAPALFSQMDDRKYVKYNISSRISVEQMFSSPITRNRLLGVLGSIAEALLSVEEYMLNPSSLLLESKYIFADVTTGSAVMICLPLAEYISETNPCQYLKSIVFGAQFDPSESNEYVAKLITYLNNASAFSLDGFRKLLQELATAPAAATNVVKTATPQPASVQPSVQSASVQPVQSVPVQPSVQPVSVPPNPVQPAPQPAPVRSVRPVSKAATGPAGKPAAPAVPAEDLMTIGYLLQHYSKENKAIFDAQKDARKTSTAKTAKPAKVKTEKTKPEKAKKVKEKTDKKAKATQPNFAIPGQAAVITPGIGTSVAPVQKTEVPVRPAAPVAAPVSSAPVQASAASVAAAQPSAPLNFGETTVLSSPVCGETTVLNNVSPQTSVRPTLVRRKTGENIAVSKTVFRIGKEQSFVDYCINGNSAISRCHANIIAKNGQYYVVDTNSTNHTYVDNKMIQSNAEQLITDGSVIRFANEEFEFKLFV